MRNKPRKIVLRLRGKARNNADLILGLLSLNIRNYE